MAMANLPAVSTQSEVLSTNERYMETVAELISQGKRPNEIAALIYPEDDKKRRALRRRLWYMVRYDEGLAGRVVARARAEFLMGLGPATRALIHRADRTGRPDAVKLLYEASGFHNPRVKHEHSGEIKVKISTPRPKFDEVVDAEVVEE